MPATEVSRQLSALLKKPSAPASYCSFCGRASHEVEVLIAGPAVFICDECVELCCEIIVQRRARNVEAAHG